MKPDIVCWGDSLSTATIWPQRLQDAFPERHIYAQAVGGEGAEKILGRMFGQVLLPVECHGQGASRTVRMRTRRYIISRLDLEGYRAQWPRQLALYDPIERLEFRLGDRVIAQAVEPVRHAARTDVRNAPTRIFCDAHGLAEGDHVWFETEGVLPAPLEAARTDEDGARHPARHYYIRNPDAGSFEIAEFPMAATAGESLPPVLDLGCDADGALFVVPGYEGVWRAGAEAVELDRIRLHPVFARNRATHILWIGANSLPDDNGSRYGGASRVPFVQAHTRRAIDYLRAFTDRILVMTVLNGSYPPRGPDSLSTRDAIELNRWIREAYPDNTVDIIARLHAARGSDEPSIPALLPLTDSEGQPIREADGAPRMAWVGPGYTPMQFRPDGDRIHLNDAGNDFVGAVLAKELRVRGW